MTYNRGSAFDLLLVRWSALRGDGAHLRLPDMAMVTMVTMATLWSLYGQWCLIVPTNERPCRVMLEIVTVRVRRGRGGAAPDTALIAVFCPCPVSSPEPGVTHSIVQCACAICGGLANRIDLDLHIIRSLRPARYLYIFISLALYVELLTKNLNIQLPIAMV